MSDNCLLACFVTLDHYAWPFWTHWYSALLHIVFSRISKERFLHSRWAPFLPSNWEITRAESLDRISSAGPCDGFVSWRPLHHSKLFCWDMGGRASNAQAYYAMTFGADNYCRSVELPFYQTATAIPTPAPAPASAPAAGAAEQQERQQQQRCPSRGSEMPKPVASAAPHGIDHPVDPMEMTHWDIICYVYSISYIWILYILCVCYVYIYMCILNIRSHYITRHGTLAFGDLESSWRMKLNFRVWSLHPGSCGCSSPKYAIYWSWRCPIHEWTQRNAADHWASPQHLQKPVVSSYLSTD